MRIGSPTRTLSRTIQRSGGSLSIQEPSGPKLYCPKQLFGANEYCPKEPFGNELYMKRNGFDFGIYFFDEDEIQL